MKKSIVTKTEGGIDKKDIDKAIKSLIRYIATSGKTKNEKQNSREITDNGKHIFFHYELDPNSPYDQIREGKPIQIKTVFHAVEGEIEDSFGGKLSYTYSMKATAGGLYDSYRQNFPSVSKSDIDEYAKVANKDFAAAKKEITFNIAERCILDRIELAKYLHTELEPTLKIVLGHLIDDALLSVFSGFTQAINGSQQLERTLKPYLNYRKERTKIVRRPGRQKGFKEEVYPEDGEIIKRKVLSAMQKLSVKGYGAKEKVAKELYPNEFSNPHQKLDRKLKSFGFSYQEILNEFLGKT